MREPSGDQLGPRSSSALKVRRVSPVPSTLITYISARFDLWGSSVTGWLVNRIRRPSGDQSASSSIASGLFVRFIGPATPSSKSSTFATKMSLSIVGAPASVLVGRPVPDAEAWKAMFLLSEDQAAELPRIKNRCSSPLVSITNRSEVLFGSPSARFRLLSNTIFFPSGDKAAKALPPVFSVSRRGFEPSGLIR